MCFCWLGGFGGGGGGWVANTLMWSASVLGGGFGALAREWGFTYWSSEKATRTLGYRPRYNFPEFFGALKEGNRAYYPYADLPWWGI